MGSTQNICASLTSDDLGGNAAAPGLGLWSQTSSPGTTVFSNPNSENAFATASVAGTYVYTWTISNGTCAASSANITVNFLSTPDIATVGPDQNLCGVLTSAPLGGNNPIVVGTGLWTQTSGPGTTVFSNPTSGTSTATASLPGVYTYEWTISNGTCTPNTAMVTVSYFTTPTVATAGPAQNICGSLTSTPLGGNAALSGTGIWTQTSGPGVSLRKY